MRGIELRGEINAGRRKVRERRLKGGGRKYVRKSERDTKQGNAGLLFTLFNGIHERQN